MQNAVFNSPQAWFSAQGWQVHPFQEACWHHWQNGESGLLNAPTGSGKTYGILLPLIAHAKKEKGLKAIWIVPIRALSLEIEAAAQRACEALNPHFTVAVRNGDTSTAKRTSQKKRPPNLLITTPETLHQLLAQKDTVQYFAHLETVIVDEWHELLGSKRGVQMELALSRLVALRAELRVWGISATVGNLQEAAHVLCCPRTRSPKLVRGDLAKRLSINAVFPKAIDELPWAGHLGIRLVPEVVSVVEKNASTLIFTNTRGQAELWYRQLLEARPDWAGLLALHHGSMDKARRIWVEDALHKGTLKAVVCTSSLDLGVDFRPVDAVVQVGSPKGVARFLQRAGRSGHRPGATSRLWFVPTHSIELAELAALRAAVAAGALEDRNPLMLSFDVLLQYLLTLAVGDGFDPTETLKQVRSTHAFSLLEDSQWQWCLSFLTLGGAALGGYNDFKKLILSEGKYRVADRKIALRHRLSIGTIVSETMVKVAVGKGKALGVVEESFAARLKPGDAFWFAGRCLQFVRFNEMTLQAKPTKPQKAVIPSWQGGRMPLSARLSAVLRTTLSNAANDIFDGEEMQFLRPLLEWQRHESALPAENELLVEAYQSKEGYHALIFPFEGRFVHEGMAALLAYRLAQIKPITFSLAMNDYGFELLSDSPFDIELAIENGLFKTEGLLADISASANATEMAKRRFREIASIAGLVFNGYPGQQKRERHLQASSELFYKVFDQFDPENLLLQQALDEALQLQFEEARLRDALNRMTGQRLVLKRPARFGPLAFPIIVDRMRESLTSEQLEARIARMKLLS